MRRAKGLTCCRRSKCNKLMGNLVFRLGIQVGLLWKILGISYLRMSCVYYARRFIPKNRGRGGVTYLEWDFCNVFFTMFSILRGNA